jgi:hypothetical protein
VREPFLGRHVQQPVRELRGFRARPGDPVRLVEAPGPGGERGAAGEREVRHGHAPYGRQGRASRHSAEDPRPPHDVAQHNRDHAPINRPPVPLPASTGQKARLAHPTSGWHQPSSPARADRRCQNGYLARPLRSPVAGHEHAPPVSWARTAGPRAWRTHLSRGGEQLVRETCVRNTGMGASPAWADGGQVSRRSAERDSSGRPPHRGPRQDARHCCPGPFGVCGQRALCSSGGSCLRRPGHNVPCVPGPALCECAWPASVRGSQARAARLQRQPGRPEPWMRHPALRPSGRRRAGPPP